MSYERHISFIVQGLFLKVAPAPQSLFLRAYILTGTASGNQIAA